MAIGTVTDLGPCRSIELLASATATNGVPSAATDGLDMNLVAQGLAGKRPEKVSIVVASTAGSGTMTVTCKLWGYCPGAATWVPLGTDETAANKGLLNDGDAIPEGPTADTITHAEPLEQQFDFSRLYLEITAIGGTSTAITAWIQWQR